MKNIFFGMCKLFFGVLITVQVNAQETTCEYQKTSIMPITFSGNSLLPIIEGKINKNSVMMLLDTGSNLTYIMPDTARKFELYVGKPTSVANGVGGISTRSVTRPNSFEIGILQSEKPYLFVLNTLGFKPYFDVIAGADYLFILDMGVNFQTKEIEFYKQKNCLIYPKPEWATTELVYLEDHGDDDRPHFNVVINGVSFRAIIDTAAGATTLSASAAKRLGIDIETGQFVEGESMVGVGQEKEKTWSVMVESLVVGQSVLENRKIAIGKLPEEEGKSPELILGKDFLMEFRVLFSSGSRRLFIAKF